MAVEATKSNLNEFELKQKAEAKRKKEELEQAQKMAKELEDKIVTVKVKTGENGKLFGSVTNKEVAEEIVKQTGLKIDKKKVSIGDPIKMVGERQPLLNCIPRLRQRLQLKLWKDNFIKRKDGYGRKKTRYRIFSKYSAA